MSQAAATENSPREEQLIEYDRLVQLFIKEQVDQQSKSMTIQQRSSLNPFNSSAQSQRKLTRLECDDLPVLQNAAQ